MSSVYSEMKEAYEYDCYPVAKLLLHLLVVQAIEKHFYL